MIEPKTITVGGEDIIIQSLPATRALSTLATLTKILGGAGKGIQDFPSMANELRDALSGGTLHLGKMMEGVLDQIDPDITSEFIKTVVRASVPTFEGDGAEGRFDAWYESKFSRGLDDLFFLLKEIFVHNFGDPVEWIKKTMARAEKAGWIPPSEPSSQETQKKQPTAS